ncbi:MAG: carboxypeptidase regulatory-like domain-containing protein [Gemmatimonadota bacterium]
MSVRTLRRFVPLLVLLVAPATMSAQSVRGTVLDRADRPLAGVVVTLLDSAQREVTRVLTSETGEYRFVVASPGGYQLRALRIGFQPVQSPVVRVDAGATVTVPLVLDGIRVQLTGMRVVAQNSCGRRVANGNDEVLQAWDQATGSLATVALRSTRGLSVTSLLVRRELDAPGKRVRAQQSSIRTANTVDPWRSTSIEILRERGYVWIDVGDTVTYNAPGLDVMLSSRFVDDHCLGLAVSRDSSEIAVSFEPTPERRRRSEVRGTLWLSRATAELRRMEFEFVNVPETPERTSGPKAGGCMSFTRLPDGAVLITNWDIVMPQLVRSSRPGSMARVASVVTAGGRILSIRRGNEALYSSPKVELRGSVRDSISNREVAGAIVELAGTGMRTATDRNGNFSLDDVLPGAYTLVARTPALDSIGASDIMPVLVAEGEPQVAMRVTTPERWIAAQCGAGALADSAGQQRGAVAGRLRTGSDTTGLREVAVFADWTEFAGNAANATVLRASGQRLETRTERDGSFRLCGVPVGVALSVSATPSRGRAEPASVRLTGDRRLAIVSIPVDVTRAAVATLDGIVVADSATPVRDAEISIPALALSARSDSAGRFRIANVTPGAHEVVVRRVGFAVVAASVTFAPNTVVERRVALRPLTLLDSVAVRSTRLDPMMSEFEANRRIGIGTFVTRDMLARDGERQLGSILSQLPGVRLARGQANRAWIMSTRSNGSIFEARIAPSKSDVMNGASAGCYAKVVVDNVLVYGGSGGEPLFDANSITADRVEAIEYYAGAAQTPARYAGLGASCGVVVIYTRR